MNYTSLKTLMGDRGYPVSEGGDWLASDTPHFIAFATRELGISYSVAHHMLAYPQAFPYGLQRLEEMSQGQPSASAPIEPDSVTAPAEPDADQSLRDVSQDPDVLSMSADNQPPKEDPVQEPQESVEDESTGEAEEAQDTEQEVGDSEAEQDADEVEDSEEE